jgi:hypothetical protein
MVIEVNVIFALENDPAFDHLTAINLIYKLHKNIKNHKLILERWQDGDIGADPEKVCLRAFFY